MDILNIILILSIVVILYFLAKKFFALNLKKSKPSSLKKEEIITMYEKQMREVIHDSHLNNEKLKIKKMQTLKRINIELSTNIFFDKDEVRMIIQKLSNMY